MPDPLETLAVSLGEALTGGDAETALRQIVGFVQTVNEDPTAAGHVFASRRLDALLASVAASLPPVTAPAADSDHTAQIYLATEIYPTGGHTRVLEDYIAAQPGRSHRVLLTNLHRRPPTDEILQRFSLLGAQVTWAQEPGLVATAQWVAHHLTRQPLARIFLFVHHEDAPAWVGCLLARPERLYLCHHADHHLALGLHLPTVRSIELTPFSFHHSRDVLGVADVIYLPLTSREIAARPSEDFAASPCDQTFVTCSSGNPGKFRIDYPFPYPEMVAGRLERFGGSHLHIGGLDESALAALAAACSLRHVNPSRLRHIPQVPDLGAAMALNQVSVYLSSFPIVGARAAIEVMASGTPIVGHHHLWSQFLGGECLLPPQAPAWRRPADLWEILAEMTPRRQSESGAAGRLHWENNHRPATLTQSLAAHDLTGLPDPSPNASPLPDPLHDFFARRAGGTDFASQQKAAARLLALQAKLARAQTALEKARHEVQRLRRTRNEPSPGWIEKALRPLAKLEKSVRKRLSPRSVTTGKPAD